jgi:hypothetical protein
MLAHAMPHSVEKWTAARKQSTSAFLQTERLPPTDRQRNLSAVQRAAAIHGAQHSNRHTMQHGPRSRGGTCNRTALLDALLAAKDTPWSEIDARIDATSWAERILFFEFGTNWDGLLASYYMCPSSTPNDAVHASTHARTQARTHARTRAHAQASARTHKLAGTHGRARRRSCPCPSARPPARPAAVRPPTRAMRSIRIHRADRFNGEPRRCGLALAGGRAVGRL